MKDTKSRKLYFQYKDITPGGVQSNFRSDSPNPLYFSRGKGAILTDIDENKYIDLIVGNGSVILGHNDADIGASVRDVIEIGLLSGYETKLSFEVAEMLHRMVPSARKVRFANSGTEAVMHAIHMARSFTGRHRILKFEGCYHGWYDYIAYSHSPPLGSDPNDFVSPDFDGVSPLSAKELSVVRFNDVDATRKALREQRDELAAVIVEPIGFNMGCVLPNPDFLPVIREETEKYGIPLIFDEVITGFRIAPGGAQKHYGIIPDITTLGKAIANGYPLSAVVGREDIMDIAAPGSKSTYAGTYNGNQVVLAAAKATLTKLQDGKVQKYLAEKTSYLEESIHEISSDSGIAVELKGMGGQFQVYFTNKDIVDYSSAASADSVRYGIFREQLKSDGVLLHKSFLFHHGITYSHNNEVIEEIVVKLRKSIMDVANHKVGSV